MTTKAIIWTSISVVSVTTVIVILLRKKRKKNNISSVIDKNNRDAVKIGDVIYYGSHDTDIYTNEYGDVYDYNTEKLLLSNGIINTVSVFNVLYGKTDNNGKFSGVSTSETY